MRRPAPLTIVLGAATVLVAVVAIVAVGESSSSSGARETTVTVSRGVVQSTVTGNGSLAPANQVDLSFETSGRVTHVAVHAGQHVSRGQLLARIDDTSQRVALAQARATLTSAEATLTQVRSGSSSSSSSSQASSSATASAATATTAVARTATVATTTPTTTTPAATTPTTTTPTTTTPTNQGARHQQQQQQEQTTKKTSSSSSGGGSNGGASSSQPQQTEAEAEAAVASAALGVKQAEADLAETTLRAPMAATVAAVSGQVGDVVGSSSSSGSSGGGGGANSSSSSSSGFVTLAQLSGYKMSVSLSEADIGKVRTGQAATVTVNAANDEEFAGRVTEVSVLPASSSSGSSSSSSGAVSYPVTVSLDQTGSKLKAGMSASTEIIVSQASGVVVPNQALTGSTVTVERDGKRSTQAVQIGVQGDSTTQVVSGLKEGDTVVVRAATVTGTGGTSGTSQTGRFGQGGLGGGGLTRRFGGGGFGAAGGGGGPPPGAGGP